MYGRIKARSNCIQRLHIVVKNIVKENDIMNNNKIKIDDNFKVIYNTQVVGKNEETNTETENDFAIHTLKLEDNKTIYLLFHCTINVLEEISNRVKLRYIGAMDNEERFKEYYKNEVIKFLIDDTHISDNVFEHINHFLDSFNNDPLKEHDLDNDEFIDDLIEGDNMEKLINKTNERFDEIKMYVDDFMDKHTLKFTQ